MINSEDFLCSDRFVDVAFGKHPIGELLKSLNNGDTLSAAHLLTVADGESEGVLDELLEHLSDMGVTLDINDLPRYSKDSQMALRLRQEEQLVKQRNLMQGLKDTDPLRLYLEELSTIPACGDITLLADKLRRVNREEIEDDSVRTNVLNLMLHRVVETACTYAGKGVLLLDLIQEGSMGLWEALHLYHADHEGDIEEFCDWWINWYMTKAVVKQALVAGVGQKLRESLEDYRSADEKLLSELGRNPTAAEIAEALHITEEETNILADMLENARLLQHAKQPEPEQLPQEEDQAVEDTAYFQMRQRIAELLSVLPEQEAKLLTLRYGLEGALPMNARQVADRLGLTESEVTEIETAALMKLRQQN